MSHVEKVAIEDVKDLDALKKACQQLGVEFRQGQKTWQWYGRWVNDFHADSAAYRHGIDPKDYGTCEHAIRLPGCQWEVGLMRTADMRLVPVYDNYGSHGRAIEKHLGKGLGKLVAEYGCQVTTKVMQRQGYRVSRRVHPKTGRPQILCTR